jgi:hypothetical protein
MEEQHQMGIVETGRLTITKPERTSWKMLNAIGDSLSDLACFAHEEQVEHVDDDEEAAGHGKLSEDDQPGWVMGTASKTVQHCMVSFWQKPMMFDELTQPEWGDAADHLGARDQQYATTELQVPAVEKPQTDSTAATPSTMTFG